MGSLPIPSERDALALRTLPTMTLSSATNPLTAPPPPLYPSLSAADRALARFAVKGNVVITGGAGVLALASARALLEHGASGVALLDLESTLASSQSAIQLLRSDFPHARIVDLACDITSEKVAYVIRDAAIALNTPTNNHSSSSTHRIEPRISMLLCFAGIVGCVPSLSCPASQWRKIIDVNLNGAFLCAQAAAKYMMPSFINTNKQHTNGYSRNGIEPSIQGGGRIVFVASMSGHIVNYPQPQSAYNVSKAGLLHLTRSLAAEWATYGIRVNSISPGYMDTVLNAGDNLNAVREVWAQRCPMGRMGDIEELTGVVVMLCAERAGGYVTGADVLVDGGTSCF
jgi:sorbose reductase